MKNLPATKADLDKLEKKLVEKLATKDELGAVEKRLNGKIDNLDKKIDGVERAVKAVTRLDIDERAEELEEKINLLPTKNEFFMEMDKLMKELQTIREEQTVGGYQLKDHEDRIGVLEQTAGIAAA